MDLDLPEGEKELAELGIFTPIEKRYEIRKYPYWVVPNQKILILDAKILPKELLNCYTKTEPSINRNLKLRQMAINSGGAIMIIPRFIDFILLAYCLRKK